MLLLLPPSEGKADPRRGKPLDLETLVFGALTEARRTVLRAMVDLCEGPADHALAVLGLTPGQAGDLERNRRVETAPTVAASTLYSGVLFDHLGLDTLDAAARRRANRTVLVSSGLWGVLRLTDRVPGHRLSGGVSLPPLGSLAGFWRGPLSGVLPGWVGRRLLLDLRSGTYAAAWRPAGALAERTVTVRVTQGGKVVSHHNKATKGRLARALLSAGVEPRTPSELLAAAVDLGFAATLAGAGGAGRPSELTIDEPAP